MDLVTGNTALNSSALDLAVNNYFQNKSRTVICNEEMDMMTSPRVATIWRRAEKAAEGKIPFALHYSDTFSQYEGSL